MTLLTWEQIDPYHQRAAVIGGWLVKAYEDVHEDRGFGNGMECGYNWRVAMTFVPDAHGDWIIGEKS